MQKVSPEEIITGGLKAGMDEVGRKFKEGDFFVPEVLLAARAMQASLDVLRPLLSATGMPTIGRVVIGTVFGDMHDIGKRLVAMLLEGTGFEVIDLGVNVPPERFVEAVRERSPHIVGLSALLTTTMPNMGKTIEALQVAEVRPAVKVVVGGAPVTQGFADYIGADGYAPDGGSAAELCRRLVGR